jgi:excisionase family DNA binding protein
MTVTAPDSGGTTILLTVEEAARQLRIGRTRMYHLVTTGAVESVSIGRLRRVPIECLNQYVKTLLGSAGQCEKAIEGEG